MNTTNGMKVAFFTPYFTEARGNATTAKRLISGLKEQGYHVERFTYEEDEWTKEDMQRLFHCDIIHILHFSRFSKWKKKAGFSITKPYILTTGGTDVNHDIYDEARQETFKKLLHDATAITVFSQDGKDKLVEVFPFTKDKISVIPSSFWLPEEKQDSQQPILHGRSPQILLPAGLRRVKDVLYLLPALKKLKETNFPGLTFSIVGTIIENEVYLEVKEACTTYDWVHFHHELPLEKMAQVYNEADAVVNSSLSEGQSGAIVEALYLKKPVVARKISGNESLIKDGVNGLLFDTLEEFEEKFRRLLDDKHLYDNLIENGYQMIKQGHSLEQEMRAYTRVYETMVNKNHV